MVSAEPKPANVIEAILAVMRDVRAVEKRGHNAQNNYDFRGIDGTVNALGPAMRAHGLVCVPHDVVRHESSLVEVGKNRTLMSRVTVTQVFRFYGPGGVEDHIDVQVPGEAMDSGDKATPKAMSVAFRTCLLQSFSLPTQERDPDADTFERSPAREPFDAATWRTSLAGASTVDDLTAMMRSLVAAQKAGEVDEETFAALGREARARRDELGEAA